VQEAMFQAADTPLIAEVERSVFPPPAAPP
jgi:hypothetical protein